MRTTGRWIVVEHRRRRDAELRAHLQTLLPTYALPGAFVVVDELPMTANGKLDDARLPAPQRVERPSPSLVVAPTTPLERTIVESWERALGVEAISVDDDFFALGGDSLAASLEQGGLDTLHCHIAFWALYADVADRISDALDTYESEAAA